MTSTEVILICALLGWIALAFGIVLLVDVAVRSAKTWRLRTFRSSARTARPPQLARPRLGSS